MGSVIGSFLDSCQKSAVVFTSLNVGRMFCEYIGYLNMLMGAVSGSFLFPRSGIHIKGVSNIVTSYDYGHETLFFFSSSILTVTLFNLHHKACHPNTLPASNIFSPLILLRPRFHLVYPSLPCSFLAQLELVLELNKRRITSMEFFRSV